MENKVKSGLKRWDLFHSRDQEVDDFVLLKNLIFVHFNLNRMIIIVFTNLIYLISISLIHEGLIKTII